MAPLKEYIVKIKWQHDQGSKKNAIKEMQAAFQGLNKDIDKSVRSIQNFNKQKIDELAPGIFKMERLPARLLPHVRLKSHIARSKARFSDAFKSVKSGNALEGLSYASEAMGEGAGALGAGIELAAPIIGPLGLIATGIGTLTAATVAIGKKIDKYASGILQTAIGGGARGFGPMSFELQSLQRQTGLNLQPLGNLTGSSIAAGQGNPQGIQSIMAAANRLRFTDPTDPNAMNLASYIQNQGIGGNLTGMGLISRIMAMHESPNRLFTLLRSMGLDKNTSWEWSHHQQMIRSYLKQNQFMMSPQMQAQVLQLQLKVATMSNQLLVSALPIIQKLLPTMQTAVDGVIDLIKFIKSEWHEQRKINRQVYAMDRSHAKDPYDTFPHLDKKLGAGDNNNLVTNKTHSAHSTYYNYTNSAYQGGL